MGGLGLEDSLIRCGKGEDLVMLHGYLSCKESFYHQIKYLSNFYKVTAFDFRGMGKSAPLAQPWSVEDYAYHTRRLLDELGVRRPRLLAHSFGGRVAIRLLADGFPAHSALLTGCAGVPPKRGLRYRLRVKTYRFVRKIAPRYAEKKFGSAEYRSLSPVMKESFKKIVGEDLTPLLPRIRVPVLYVFGEKDTATPLWMARVLREKTPHSELVVMRGCTHFCFCEKWEEFNAVAREFFRC